MNRQEIVALIVRVMRQNFGGEKLPEHIGQDTVIFGAEGFIDSLGLVTLIEEVEVQINELCNTDIMIVSERAMSQEQSPFRSVGALAGYIEQLLAEGIDAGK